MEDERQFNNERQGKENKEREKCLGQMRHGKML